MEKYNKLSGRAIVSFFASFAVCTLIIGGLILFGPTSEAWYTHPGNISLIIAGLLICILFSLLMQSSYELKQMKGYFDNMVITDALTHVYNRRYVHENIDRLVKSVSRSGGVLTVLIIDVDFFQSYNDAYGYKKGDNCLKIIANVLTQSIKRDNDCVARYGGNEFLIILPNTDENGAHIIANRLLKNIRDCNLPHGKNSAADYITISVGATTGGKDFSHSGEDYINKAKEALQNSIQNGCDRYTFLNL